MKITLFPWTSARDLQKKMAAEGGNQALVPSSVFLSYFMSVPFLTTKGNWVSVGWKLIID